MPLNNTQLALLNYLEDTNVPKRISSDGASRLAEYAKKWKLTSTINRSVIAASQENPDVVRTCWCFGVPLLDGWYAAVINVNPNAEPSPPPKGRKGAAEAMEPIIAKYTPWGEFSSPAVALAAASLALGEGGESDFAIIARNTCMFYGLDEKAMITAVEVARKSLGENKIFVPQIAKTLAEKNVYKIHAEVFHGLISEAIEERTKSRERQAIAEAKKRKREEEKEEREAKKSRSSEPPVSQDQYLTHVEEACKLWKDNAPLTNRHYRAVNLFVQSAKLMGVPFESIKAEIREIATHYEKQQSATVNVTATQISQLVDEHAQHQADSE